MPTRERPLSPFMIGQVYKPQITSVLSILHRATGVALAVGALGFAAWLLAVAGTADAFECFRWFLASWLGKAALFAFTACLMYHLFNGLRHLAWDAGWGFEIPTVYKSGYAVVILTILVTAAIWVCALGLGGAA
ncbi:MAG TPA: succinate dehydrogenase, cytochrome b556 subunit [Arenimonas sp.]|uniref:succinate dehydrogenase, cytochrome b556 subunit n=1 Tax=Arenimonas sp. TaxID=1872635 RepID=UPI002C325CE1|nr:succinate dehydrogenase, cytochrome b556 subunit [Arenimonas sp.]HMB57326.1 succinate dehydrogenase, cytochrome b556 subunit [Arenimonas sp.]